MNKVSLFCVLALILSITNSDKFNIASTSICTNTSAAGFCTRWEQNGTVEQEIAACFPGSMIVMTREGYKRLDKLRIGDQILAYDRSIGEIYTKVRGWFHRDPSSTIEYLHIEFSNRQSLIVSQKHNIGYKNNQQNNLKFIFASDLTLQDSLFGSSQHKIARISTIKQSGLYAPMTYNNNYFVFTSSEGENVKILAHDFANIKSPESYEPLVNMAISAHEYFNGKQQQNTGVHPAADWLMGMFDFLLE